MNFITENTAVNAFVMVTPNPAIDCMVVASNWVRGEVNKGSENTSIAAGKGVNVATVLAQLQSVSKKPADITVTGWLGINNESIFIQHFKQEKLQDNFIRVDGETRTNIKISDDRMQDTTDINFSGFMVSTCQQVQLQTKVSHLAKNKNNLFVLAGSLPVGVPHNFYVDLISTLRTNKNIVILDTSAQSLQAVIDSNDFPHVLKPNIDELREVTGKALEKKEEILALASTWFEQGLAMLVVSLGAQGAIFITPDETYTCVPPKISVVSTVGAGDTMVAGIANGLFNNQPLQELARSATALSCARIMENSHKQTLLKRYQFILPQVVVEPLHNI